mgnify:CR=1 FL=1
MLSVTAEAENLLDNSSFYQYNKQRFNVERGMLHDKCDCNGENCKINIAGMISGS